MSSLEPRQDLVVLANAQHLDCLYCVPDASAVVSGGHGLEVDTDGKREDTRVDSQPEACAVQFDESPIRCVDEKAVGLVGVTVSHVDRGQKTLEVSQYRVADKRLERLVSYRDELSKLLQRTGTAGSGDGYLQPAPVTFSSFPCGK